MARGKKKESALTPEEKLAQALVPVEEQPYKVPGNWCWTRGVSIFKAMETRKPEGEYFDYIDIDAIDNTLQVVTEPKHTAVKDAPSRASRAVHYGDIIFSLVRPYLRNIAFIDEPLKDCIASTGFYVCSPTAIVIPRYLYLLMTSSYVVDGLNKYMKGDNSPSIKKDDIELFAYPIPPLEEQRRIVDRIEYLFSKLDEAKEKAQSVLDSFETRKAAILHKAFTGELTAKWRAEHNIAFDEWHSATVGDLFDVFSGKGFKEKEYSSSGVKLLRISNVTYDELVWEDTKYLPVEYLETVPELVLRSGDIVMALNRPITNGKLKVSIVDDQEHYILYQRVGCLRKRNPLNSTQYLQYALLSQSFLHQVESHLQGSDQPYINLPPLKSLNITMCSACEQAEIVRILDSLFAKEQQAKDAAEAVLEKIDLLKKSILARAFRSELGTNDPTDESAVELLREILKGDI